MKKALSCAQCGAKMRAGIKFCSKCGYHLVDAEAEALAVAAQAEEAAANLLTEEELASLTVAESEVSAEPETVSVAAEEAAGASAVASEEDRPVHRSVQREIDRGERIVHKTNVSAERAVARLASKGNVDVARVEGKSAVLRQETENDTKSMAARRDRSVAGGEKKAARIDSRSADRLTAMQMAEDMKAAKRRAEESKRNLRAVADVDARNAARFAREERRAIAGRRFESTLADVRDAAEATLTKRREKEALHTEKVVTANRKEDLSTEAKSARSRAKALRAEEKKAARYRRDEENAVVRERVAENNLHARRVKAEKAKLKQRAVADERMQTLRLSDELKTEKKVFAEREKATRRILKEEGKISGRENDALRRTADEKAFENRLYAKQAATEATLIKRREKEAFRTEKIVTANRKADLSTETKKARVRAKALRAEEKKAAKYRHEEENAVVRERVAENNLHARRVKAEKAKLKQRAAADERMQTLRLSDELKTEKKVFAEREKATRRILKEEGKISGRENDALRRTADEKAFENRLYAKQAATEATLIKRREKEAFRTEKIVTANRKADLSTETKKARVRAKALRAEEKKAAKYRHEEENAVVRERVAENNLHARRVKAEKAKLKQRAAADERIQTLRLAGELKTEKRVFAEREKATRLIIKEDGKLANRDNDALRLTAEEKAFENRLYAKRAAADARARKRRRSDLQRVAAKQAAVRERETKRLGSIEYKAATRNLTDEAAEARRQADLAEREMQSRHEEQKLNEKEAAGEKRLIRLRAADRKKHSKTKMALRAKETRALGRAEMRALRVTKTDEAMETRRKTDEVKLHIDQKTLEDKLYSKKLAAERRMIRVKAEDDGRLQKEELKNRQMLHEAQMLEESRASRIRTDDTKRAVRDQKNQDELYQRKKTADDKISDREHKLELKRTRIENDRNARVMNQKEKEQRRNLKLMERQEKAALKRARKIERISGVPVSLVPALSGDTAPTALLSSGGVTEVGTATLHDPDALLAASYETNSEQYEAHKKNKKKNKDRRRIVEINVRNDRYYFNTDYRYDGHTCEAMVAKRTVYVNRIQAILAILLMLVALVASVLPMATLGADALPGSFYTDQRVVSLESVLSTEQSDPSNPIAYLTAVLSRVTDPEFAQKASERLSSLVNMCMSDSEEPSGLQSNPGKVISFLFLVVAMILTPILLVVNLLIAIIKLLFTFGRPSAGITRIMKNLRGSFLLIGFYLLSLAILKIEKFEIGFYVLVGAFAAAVVLNFILSRIKRYEKGDRKYLSYIQMCGALRSIILAGFFLVLHFSGVFAVSLAGDMIALIALALSYVFFYIATLWIPTLGFTVAGYTTKHRFFYIGAVVFGLLGCILAFVPHIMGLVDSIKISMLVIAAALMVVYLVITVVFLGLRQFVVHRYKLLDPIRYAVEEGFPLK